MRSPETKPPKAEPTPLLLDHRLLEQAVLANPYLNLVPRGEIRMLAVPAMLDRYVAQLEGIFEAAGHPFSPSEMDQLREKLGARIDRAFAEHANSFITLTFEPIDPPNKGLHCSFKSSATSAERNYETWINHREPPLFGAHPDARVMSVAGGIPAPARILDVGAGTGRNALPLARLGHEVCAIEPTPSFAEEIRTTAAAEGLSVAVHRGNVLDPAPALEAGSFRLAIIVEVVTSHFRGVEHLRSLFSRMAELLAPNGLLLFDAFLTRGGFEPEPLVRELSQVVWSSLFTRDQLREAMVGLPLKIIAETPELEYEQANRSPEAWPPTGWYTMWAQGRNLFRVTNDGLPIELRWILCKRT